MNAPNSRHSKIFNALSMPPFDSAAAALLRIYCLSMRCPASISCTVEALHLTTDTIAATPVMRCLHTTLGTL